MADNDGKCGAFIDNLWQVELWEPLSAQLHPANLVMLACTNRQLRATLEEDSIWEGSLRACIDIAFEFDVSKQDGVTWRYLAMQVLDGLKSLDCPGAEGFPTRSLHLPSRVSKQLAIKAINSSTQDRDEEDKKHVLSRSKCGSGREEDQSQCNCKDGSKPCYWSSRETSDADSNEFISLRLKSTVCLIHSMTIQPYQAWWQTYMPDMPKPVYAPREVFLEFGALKEGLDASGSPIIEDRWISVAATRCHSVPHTTNGASDDVAVKGLEYVFARPLLVLGGYCKIHLLGKVQRQPVSGQNEFYCCLSYAGLRGVALRSVSCRPVKDASQQEGAAAGGGARQEADDGKEGSGQGGVPNRSEQDGLNLSVRGKLQLLKTKSKARKGAGKGGAVELPMQCGWCGSHQEGEGTFRCSSALQICAGCRRVWYCNSHCQKKNHNSHKEECKAWGRDLQSEAAS